MKKRLIVVAILAVMVMLLAACGGNSIEGKWKVTGGDDAAFSGMPEGLSIFFTFKSGTLTVEMENAGQKVSMEGKYTIDGDKITIEGDVMGGTGTYKIEGNKLTITSNGMAVEFTRQ